MVRIQGRFGYNALAHDMYQFLGVKSLPVEGMPEREIQGVRVYVKPLPFAPPGGHRNFQGLRVMAICTCGQHVPVGRLHQHKCKESICEHGHARDCRACNPDGR